MSNSKPSLNVASLILSTIALLISIYSFNSHKTIVAFDEQALTRTFIKQLSERNLTESQSKKLSRSFSVHLKESLKEYAKNHYVAVVTSLSVVEGVDDVTDKIQKLIATKMQKGKQ